MPDLGESRGSFRAEGAFVWKAPAGVLPYARLWRALSAQPKLQGYTNTISVLLSAGLPDRNAITWTPPATLPLLS